MKFRNKIKLSWELFFHGRWITRGITILLSAFAFTLFTIASMAYTYNEDEYYARGYRHYLENIYPYVNFTTMLENKGWTSEEVARIQETTELPYAYIYDDMTGKSAFSHYQYSQPSDYNTPEKEKIYANLSNKVNDMAIVGSEEVYEEFGLQPVAGRYPENVHEIAISTGQFDMYKNYGFHNLTDHFEWYQDRWQPNAAAAPVEKINEYSDILGKKLVLLGNLETGDEVWRDIYEVDRNGIYKVEIVGIIQTNEKQVNKRRYRPYPDESLFLSQEWEEIFHKDHEGCGCMISPERPSDSQLSKSVSLTKDFVEEYYHQHPDASQVPAVGLADIDFILEIGDITNPHFFTGLGGKTRRALIWGVEGVIFCVFAISLMGYLMTAMVNKKHKQIGILRSLGASQRQVSGYFLIGTLILSGIIFLIALAMSLGLYYAYVVPLTTNVWFDVPQFVFSGWTVLILAGICFVVPVLSVLVPLTLSMRRSCVEMMKDSTKGKKRTRSK